MSDEFLFHLNYKWKLLDGLLWNVVYTRHYIEPQIHIQRNDISWAYMRRPANSTTFVSFRLKYLKFYVSFFDT